MYIHTYMRPQVEKAMQTIRRQSLHQIKANFQEIEEDGKVNWEKSRSTLGCCTYDDVIKKK